MATSQNGWPASDNRAALGVKSFTVPGYPTVALAVRGDIAPLLLEMARWFFTNVEKPVMPGCWGYCYRPVRGATTGLSNHSSGTAIDLNAPRHVLGQRGTVPPGKRQPISQKAATIGLRWGGDYTGRVDEMHFEVVVSPATARNLVTRLQHPPAPTPTPTPTPAGRPTLAQGAHGAAVQSVQRVLNRWYPSLPQLAVDGEFGPSTRARVMYFQRRVHLFADGIVGPNTWRAMGFN
jgi:Putative peptidoglycan binding domain/D-alanyl-D-alanine carboxypeptidase